MRTTVTERAQVSIPAELRRETEILPGQMRVWEQVSLTECRVIVLPKTTLKPDPVAAVGFAKLHGLETTHRTTAEFMRELRGGEDD